MRLRNTTIGLLERFETAAFFDKIGQKLDAPGVVQLGSLRLAVKTFISKTSWNSRIDDQNSISTVLSGSSDRLARARYQSWNLIIAEVNNFLPNELPHRIQQVFGIAGFGERVLNEVVDAVLADLRGAAMEAEYSDLIDVRRRRDTLEWYLKGHLPCGWSDFDGNAVLEVF